MDKHFARCRRAMLAALFIVALSGALLGLARPAAADPAWQTSKRLWGQQDRCAREAFKKFPDYTREGNARREHEFQVCLTTDNLPPRARTDPAPADPPPQSADRH